MKLWKMAFAGLALSMALGVTACGSDDSGTKSGNAQACEPGKFCENKCDTGTNSCEQTCPKDGNCKATCRDGQTCSFTCEATATCNYDCTAGSCTISSASDDCKCTGTCAGTCGTNPGTGGSSGGNCNCGSPTDPNYAQCMQDCNN